MFASVKKKVRSKESKHRSRVVVVVKCVFVCARVVVCVCARASE